MRRYTLNNRIIPKLMAVVLVLALLMPLVPVASAAETGSCGANLNWSFDSGTLTITGKGAMEDYQEAVMPPWHRFREQITRLVLPEGLTYIGRMAFYNCTALTAVEIPKSVQEIGSMAFSQCTALAMVRLQEGLKVIGRSAFENCLSLADIRLPESLTTVGKRAFFQCKSLAYVTISENVTSMGNSVFSYCTGLIRAEIRAPLKELPTWTFLGCTHLSSIYLSGTTTSVGDHALYECENLLVVYYDGTPGDAEELQEQITESREKDSGGTGSDSSVSREDAGNTESVGNIKMEEDGDIIIEDTTVTQTEDSTVSVTTGSSVSEEDPIPLPVKIIATIVSEKGWQELLAQIEAADQGTGMIVTVYILGDFDVPVELLKALEGRNIQLKVINLAGTEYSMDFNVIENVTDRGSINLDYRLQYLEDSGYEELAGATVFGLEFLASSNVAVGAAIQLPMEHARRTASLYQVRSGKLELLQSTVADDHGVAYFYLASTDSKTTYFIGVDVPWLNGGEIQIPEALEKDYGVDYKTDNVEYVVTGRKSSWNMGFNDVTRILIAFMMSTAAIVGLVMYALNKRKIRQGYVPGWDDEE